MLPLCPVSQGHCINWAAIDPPQANVQRRHRWGWRGWPRTFVSCLAPVPWFNVHYCPLQGWRAPLQIPLLRFYEASTNSLFLWTAPCCTILTRAPSGWEEAPSMHVRGHQPTKAWAKRGFLGGMLQIKRCQNRTLHLCLHGELSRVLGFCSQGKYVCLVKCSSSWSSQRSQEHSTWFRGEMKGRRTLTSISVAGYKIGQPQVIKNLRLRRLVVLSSLMFLEAIAHLILHLRSFYITSSHMTKDTLTFYYPLLFKYHWWIKAKQ